MLQVREYRALCIKPTEEGKFVRENLHQTCGSIFDQRKTKFEIPPFGFCAEKGLFGNSQVIFQKRSLFGKFRNDL